MTLLRVLAPGLSTTIQDLGRTAGVEVGIPAGGAADQYSHRLCNAVLGNDAGAATLEMMLLGGRFEAMRTADVAVAGADMHFRVNDADAPSGMAVGVGAGDVISFGKARQGCFGYLAVRGGFDGTVALGSRSTYLPGRLGGHFGRALQRGDVLDAFDGPLSSASWTADRQLLDWPMRHEWLRFVRGPQAEYFTESAYRAFVSVPFLVSPRSNRIAYRMTGPAPEVATLPRTSDTGSGPTDIIEDGNAVGAIQVAGGVEPICMGRDCPTSGAYAKIGCIITPDVSRMAQMQPGDSVRFREITIDEAYEVSREFAGLTSSFGAA